MCTVRSVCMHFEFCSIVSEIILGNVEHVGLNSPVVTLAIVPVIQFSHFDKLQQLLFVTKTSTLLAMYTIQ